MGVDPHTIPYSTVQRMRETLSKKSIDLFPTPNNLIDQVWGEGRPVFKPNPVFHLPLTYSGQPAEEKIANLIKTFGQGDDQVEGMVVTALDEIACKSQKSISVIIYCSFLGLFNLRGSDIPFNPVFFSWALVTKTQGVTLHVYEPEKLNKEHLPSNVQVKAYKDFVSELKTIKKRTLLAPSCNWAIVDALGMENAKVSTTPSPIDSAKAIKNEVEVKGFRQCHIRDAAALCNFFGWLEDELLNKKNTTITECQAADKLYTFRAEQEDFVDLSFDTISSAGPNAAIIHYKPEVESCARITTNQIFLLDSGGQYKDGTTDVTRTSHFGQPTEREREAFTRVLLGNLNLQRAVFPTGTTGYQLDPIARLPLWQIGLDYGHGTGHGVGHFLNVHEGPHGISFSARSNETPLRPFMTVTDEPGYYEDGSFGIRIENVLLVKPLTLPNNFRDVNFLGFENITMVPIQTSLIKKELLEQVHIEMINEYHRECREKVSPLLAPGSLGHSWLQRSTQPINN